MRALAVETSSRVGSVALLHGAEVLASRESRPHRGHGKFILSEIHAVLSEAGTVLSEVDVFVANIGPGSFTGVRVGLATVRALAWSLDKPVAGADGLLALAHAADVRPGEFVSSVLDARKGEVYAGLYRRTESGWDVVQDATVSAGASWLETVAALTHGERVTYLGDGVGVLPAGIDGAEAAVSAEHLARVALADRSERGEWRLATPRYVRAAEAEVKFGLAPAHDPMHHVVRSDGERRP